MAALVLVEVQEGVATVTLNRPEAYNAFDWPLIDGLARALARLAADPRVLAVVLTGAGKAFCAGGDLKAIRAHEDGVQSAFHQLAVRFHAAVGELRRMPKPAIAAVNGVAAGGGFSLALAADFRVLGRSSSLRCAFPASGLSMDGGGTWTLPRLVGLHKALEIVAFDQTIGADEALALGLATRVVEDDAVAGAAVQMARDLAQRSVHAFGRNKRLLLEALGTSFETQLERERESIAACGVHPDGQEGMAAFAGKRKPRFNVQ